ncbi:MAG: adenosylcobalamin-dependent ribonucleoside-diphosphate reductase [Anaerolineae bacterium]|nr:adenosylcobalamin-dependent ribonucleoside-diphosphate reductase [Anaerolineae bacterium]
MNIVEEPLLEGEALEAQFSENARTVLRRRYLRKDGQGQPAETVTQMFWRVASHVAASENDYGTREQAAELFYRLLTRLRFIPNSPTFTGAGTPLGQLAACFVLPIADDMGKQSGGIFQSLRDAALIQQTGGGNGFAFSRLRPRNSLVVSSMGKATGPVGFLRVYDRAFGEIAQGGTRRGANMAVLRVDHPDIAAFVACKTSEDAITNFNISVGVLDAFMEAVENDEMWPLRFPNIEDPAYRNFHGTLEDAEAAGIAIETYTTVSARSLYERIAEQAWRNGEPGMLFLDAAQRDNPVPHLGRYESTNPCGEQFLLPYENCCLGALNLAQHLTNDDEQPAIDWEKLAESVHVATRFLDDVITANAFVPAVAQLKEAAFRSRRIGLGIMGLADLLYHLGIRYGTAEAQNLAAQLMEFIRFHTMHASIVLASERGAFPAIQGSVYDPSNLTWRPPAWPAWLEDGPRPDWKRPNLNWEALLERLRTHGIRNAAQLTVAPTGTVATVSGVEGYGCEPVFALAYTRYIHESDQKIPLRYLSPAFANALNASGISQEAQERIIDQVTVSGSCQDVEETPQSLRDVFVVAADIPAEGHIRMQAALQAFTDASISKTVNLPPSATPQDVAEAFRLAWKLGCKGLTVYVAGSREKVVLETEATRREKEVAVAPKPVPAAPWQGPSIQPRPQRLTGRTYRVTTPVGTGFITVNKNGGNQPFEVFLNVAKAGSETAAVAEAIGRLISLTLRLPSTLEPRRRLEEIVAQLGGIGGGRPLGFGHNRVLSLPDGVAQALNDYLEEPENDCSEEETHVPVRDVQAHRQQIPLFPTGDLCPSCGQATMVYTEGCRRCYVCGHSEC